MPRLEVQLDEGSYSPGEVVRGSVRAIEGGRSRGGMALLRYVERTEDYDEVAWHRDARLWDGHLEAGARFPFALALPNDATPGHVSEHGSLGWDVHARSDEFGRDTTATGSFEVTPPPGGYPLPTSGPKAKPSGWMKSLHFAGPAIGAGAGYSIARVPGAIAGGVLLGGSSVLDWRRRAEHFRVEPPSPVRRGEPARVTVRMLDASRVEGELEAELVCVERYDYRSHSKRGSRRDTAEATLFEERAPLGAQRSVEITVPPDMPFTYAGRCLSYRWKAIVRERRDNATDRLAEHPLLVVP